MLYIYVFGDRVSEIQVSGIAFAGACTGAHTITPTGNGGQSGLSEILEFYRANKISSRPTPVLLRFGDQQHVFQSFLTGCQVEASRPEINLGQFFLRFHAAPQ